MIDVLLPIRLVSEANAHAHWRLRQRRAKVQRTATALALRGAVRAIVLPVVVTITRIAPRALDDDNLSGAAKHVRDGIADALGIDDRDPCVTWKIEQARGGKGEYAVRIQIERAEERVA